MEVKNKQKYVGRIIVSQEDSFDRIQEHHRMSGHLGAESTYNNCNLKYFNITQAMVRTFCKSSPHMLEHKKLSILTNGVIDSRLISSTCGSLPGQMSTVLSRIGS